MAKILVVDDERHVRTAFEDILAGKGHEVRAVGSAEDALGRIAAEEYDLVILDICLPGVSGLDALAQIKQVRPTVPVIMMTGQGTMENAIQATKRGAFDYHLKPFAPAEMLQTIANALEGARLMKGHLALGPEATAIAAEAIVGRSAAMQQVYKAIGRVAPTDATVLIRGESGTGKELVARAIYQHSLRSHMPLVVVNCAAIPETLLESELFGHEAGAFTGALCRRTGKFEQAHGGSVFLDEIGDLPRDVQAKVLRVLQEMSFQRLGGSETLQVDARILCATNRNLEKAIAEGRFREDLYHRLNVVTIAIPPLRDRPEDIPSLVDYFLTRYSQELGISKPPLADDALALVKSRSWPGNVRELEHLIHRVLIFTQGYTIQAADLAQALENDAAVAVRAEAADDEQQWLGLIQAYLSSAGGDRTHEQLLEKVERILLREALIRCKGNQTYAARLLGLSRPTLHAKIQRYGLQNLGGESPL